MPTDSRRPGRSCELLALAPAQAAPMSRPRAEYSADSTIQSEEGTIQKLVGGNVMP